MAFGVSSIPVQPPPVTPPLGGVPPTGVVSAPTIPVAQHTGPVGVVATFQGPTAVRTLTARSVAVQNTGLSGTGKSGLKAFLASVGDRFKSLFSRPPQQGPQLRSVIYTFRQQGNSIKVAHMAGAEFESMIKALPKSQQAGAVSSLPQKITGRIQNGERIYRSIVGPNPPTSPTSKDVADLILFFRAKSYAQGDVFTNGAMSIEDPGG